jgi:hypothetical protein
VDFTSDHRKKRYSNHLIIADMESIATKKGRILNALLMGARLTPLMANEIGVTTEGTRIIRKLRELYPINKERVTGSIYYRYWIDEAFLKNRRNG